MKQKILKSTTFKLIFLLFIVLISFVGSYFIFNSQIDRLKVQIDKMYFGNLLPIIKLGIISDNYEKIIACRTLKYICDFKKEKNTIEKEWSYYNNSYKSVQERILIDKTNAQVIDSFKANKLYKFKDILRQINFLIDYEARMAESERNRFVRKYDEMKNYLFYIIILILFLSLIIIVIIIYQVLKKDSQLRILNKQYKLDSITDSMTKLYNRKYFDEIFDSMPFISNERNWNSAFIMVDIDFFKQYNDTYGHDMGDKVLKVVAKTLNEYFNKRFEYVFRLGGEEFGIILFDINTVILETCLKDINEAILNLNIEHNSSQILNTLSVSIGASIYEANSYISTNKLYKMADECLYKSKHNGRNQYHFIKGIQE